MAENLIIEDGDKAAKYAALVPQIRALLDGENDEIARMANAVAALQQTFGWLWTGFYRVVGDELVLGPFQGPIACTRIAHGKGVCGDAWARNETLVVPDVDAFPGHIACSSLSRSEIVVPLHDASGKVIAVLDVDSTDLNTYDAIDKEWLEQVAAIVTQTEAVACA
ncbi:GAF domain-containing protein [Amantichitinum ursilacus]|uniref:Free methionine-R-sulfoxide reductase n=1 Tax=Amantichitinum ursilacus TaxID=857265 RepID=A0A0N0XL27_9NEIS|nr:GAF domain-containing protein [Amantichitinum ursilacus]KPC53340.1 Free methionine-R-sulfoxide reductase [Amantichitinum ursilacus]